jgi:hypothetical protein
LTHKVKKSLCFFWIHKSLFKDATEIVILTWLRVEDAVRVVYQFTLAAFLEFFPFLMQGQFLIWLFLSELGPLLF